MGKTYRCPVKRGSRKPGYEEFEDDDPGRTLNPCLAAYTLGRRVESIQFASILVTGL